VIEYTPFGELYNNRPKCVIHGRLKNCTTVQELAQLANAKGYEVLFDEGGFANDIKLSEGFDAESPVRNHSVRTARRFLERHPGCV
jgi:hypothetical protein